MSDARSIEDLKKGKQGLGAEHTFLPDTFEVKKNEIGIKGLFTKVALKKGTKILSVPKLSGSLTPQRAYEESLDLIKKLGAERYNLDERFLITTAVYLRFTNEETKDTDLVVTEPDIKSVYHGTPMTSVGSLERAKMINGNNKIELETAKKFDSHIEKMKVDPELFRILMGYVVSRMWGKNIGIIPLLDLLNSSYDDGANCEFESGDESYGYRLLRDVEADEEILFNYNSANALDTWMSYGYLDPRRPTYAPLFFRFEDEEKPCFDKFAMETVHWPKEEVNPSYKIDNAIYEFHLESLGKAELPLESAYKHIKIAYDKFVSIRAWFRVLALSRTDKPLDVITNVRLADDKALYGNEIELNAIKAMRQALQDGIAITKARVDAFKASSVGQSIDLSPYMELIGQANEVWERGLYIIEQIIAAPDLAACVEPINETFGFSLQPGDNILSALEGHIKNSTTMDTAMAYKYIAIKSRESA